MENHLQGEAASPDNGTQGTQAPATNTNMTNVQIPFQNLRGVPNTTGPTGQSNNEYSQPPNKGLGKKASKHNNTQPSISAIFAQTSSYPQSRNLGTGHPKMFCTTCGEYNHWRKDCPYVTIVTIVTVIHMQPTCVGHHQNLPLPPLHNPLFVFTVVVQIIGQWSAVTALETTERKDVHPVQQQTGTTGKNNENLL